MCERQHKNKQNNNNNNNNKKEKKRKKWYNHHYLLIHNPVKSQLNRKRDITFLVKRPWNTVKVTERYHRAKSATLIITWIHTFHAGQKSYQIETHSMKPQVKLSFTIYIRLRLDMLCGFFLVFFLCVCVCVCLCVCGFFFWGVDGGWRRGHRSRMQREGRNKKKGRLSDSKWNTRSYMFWPTPGLKERGFNIFGFSAEGTKCSLAVFFKIEYLHFILIKWKVGSVTVVDVFRRAVSHSSLSWLTKGLYRLGISYTPFWPSSPRKLHVWYWNRRKPPYGRVLVHRVERRACHCANTCHLLLGRHRGGAK